MIILAKQPRKTGEDVARQRLPEQIEKKIAHAYRLAK